VLSGHSLRAFLEMRNSILFAAKTRYVQTTAGIIKTAILNHHLTPQTEVK
jgi:hypothetical protein